MRWWLLISLVAIACDPPPPPTTAPSAPTLSSPPIDSAPQASSAPAAPASAPPTTATGPWDTGLDDAARAARAELAKSLRAGLPSDSGDYADALSLVMLYKRKTIDMPTLQAALVARKLPPHRLGDGYLMTPSPVPPPGVDWNPARMPDDWVGNWGEVAMAYFVGELTREEYNTIHHAAHPSCKR